MNYIFSNVYRFGSDREFASVLADIGIKEDDAVVFMNMAVPLAHAMDFFCKYRIFSFHRGNVPLRIAGKPMKGIDFPCCEDVGFFYDLISRGNAIRFVREPIVNHRYGAPGSLLWQTAQRYEYVLKTAVYVQEHSRAFPPEVRCAIMQSVLKALPQWMRKAPFTTESQQTTRWRHDKK